MMQRIKIFICFLTLIASANAQDRSDKNKLKSDKAFEKFLNDLSDAIERHRWEKVFEFFDPENYAIQEKLGIEKPQYIAEGLGLGFVHNHLIDNPSDVSEYGRLNGIDKVIFGKTNHSAERIEVYGQVKLFDGTFRNIYLPIRLMADGKYRICPAVG